MWILLILLGATASWGQIVVGADTLSIQADTTQLAVDREVVVWTVRQAEEKLGELYIETTYATVDSLVDRGTHLEAYTVRDTIIQQSLAFRYSLGPAGMQYILLPAEADSLRRVRSREEVETLLAEQWSFVVQERGRSPLPVVRK